MGVLVAAVANGGGGGVIERFLVFPKPCEVGDINENGGGGDGILDDVPNDATEDDDVNGPPTTVAKGEDPIAGAEICKGGAGIGKIDDSFVVAKEL